MTRDNMIHHSMSDIYPEYALGIRSVFWCHLPPFTPETYFDIRDYLKFGNGYVIIYKIYVCVIHIPLDQRKISHTAVEDRVCINLCWNITGGYTNVCSHHASSFFSIPWGVSAPAGKMRKQFLKDHNFLNSSPIFIIKSSTFNIFAFQKALHTIHFNLKNCFGFGERYLTQ